MQIENPSSSSSAATTDFFVRPHTLRSHSRSSGWLLLGYVIVSLSASVSTRKRYTLSILTSRCRGKVQMISVKSSAQCLT